MFEREEFMAQLFVDRVYAEPPGKSIANFERSREQGQTARRVAVELKVYLSQPCVNCVRVNKAVHSQFDRESNIQTSIYRRGTSQ
jgi:hypothetical protein